MHIFGAVARRL